VSLLIIFGPLVMPTEASVIGLLHFNLIYFANPMASKLPLAIASIRTSIFISIVRHVALQSKQARSLPIPTSLRCCTPPLLNTVDLIDLHLGHGINVLGDTVPLYLNGNLAINRSTLCRCG
jgi:hypothetical protein